VLHISQMPILSGSRVTLLPASCDAGKNLDDPQQLHIIFHFSVFIDPKIYSDAV
jgi:hypothetical protein